MNPEFRRHLWLELTPQRLVAAPAILALILFTGGLSGGEASVAFWCAASIMLLYAPRLAARAVTAEVAARTWDFQRASALSAVQMAVGKLFGGTVFAWYAAGCAAARSLLAPGWRGPTDWAQLALAGVIATGAALIAALLAVRGDPRPGRAGAFGPQLIGFACGLAAASLLSGSDLPAGVRPLVLWWGYDLTPGLVTALVAAFAAFAMIGSWRLMAEVLQIPAGGWVWSGFLLWLGLFGAGFAPEAETRAMLSFAAILPAAYVAALADPRSAVQLRRWRADILAGHVSAMWRGLPPWLLAALVLTALAVAVPSRLADWYAQGLFGGLRISVWPMLLLFLRDVALMYLVAGRSGGLAAIVVWLAVAYAVLPSALNAMGLPNPALVLLPVPALLDQAWWQLPGIAAQALVLAALAWWRTPRIEAAAARG